MNYQSQPTLARRCFICGEVICECMGYVLARDFLKLRDNPNANVREICGKCGERSNLIETVQGIQ